MAVVTAKTLVVRGVSVVGDGFVVDVRLGQGAAIRQPRMLAPSMRHLLPGYHLTQQGQWSRAVNGPDNAAALRAGRPGCRAAVLSRSRPASFAGRIRSSAWSFKRPSASKRWLLEQRADKRFETKPTTLRARARGEV